MEELVNELNREIDLTSDDKQEILNIYSSLERFHNNVIIYEKDCPSTIRLDDVETNHAIKMFDCVEKSLTVSKKINHITLVNCTKVNLLVKGCVSGIDLIRCNHCIITLADYDHWHIDVSNSNNNSVQLHTDLLAGLFMMTTYSLDNKLVTYKFIQEQPIVTNRMSLPASLAFCAPSKATDAGSPFSFPETTTTPIRSPHVLS